MKTTTELEQRKATLEAELQTVTEQLAKLPVKPGSVARRASSRQEAWIGGVVFRRVDGVIGTMAESYINDHVEKYAEAYHAWRLAAEKPEPVAVVRNGYLMVHGYLVHGSYTTSEGNVKVINDAADADREAYHAWKLAEGKAGK